MKRYFSLLALLMAAAACTKVDDTLGQRLIPRDQQMVLRVDTLSPFDAYIAKNDSLPASGHGRIFFGRRIDPVFGKIDARSMTTFWPLAMDELLDGRMFGHNPVADSIFIDITIYSITGDASIEQTFNVYALRDSMKRDSVYKMHTPIEPYVDMTKPLFSFKLSDNYPSGAMALLKLEPTDDGRAFMKRLLEVPKDVYEEPWPEFNKEFHGLYFAPAEGSPENAAVYEIELRNNYGSMAMWFHNYEESNPAVVDTMTWATYSFFDGNWYADSRKANMNLFDVEYEYPAAISDHLNDTLSTDAPLDRVYVQGLGGVMSYLKVSDELREWFSEAKGEYSDMVVSQARLLVPVEQTTFDMAPQRLGMYHDYTTAYPLSDYDYLSENSAYSSVEIPYDGYLRPSNGYYRMNITQYVTRLMLDPEGAPDRIWLGPEVNTRASQYSQVELGGEMKLIITYTLIR